MTEDEKKKTEFNERMERQARAIESAKAAHRRPIRWSEAIKGGYTAVGESAAGVIFRGR
jgi:hypothetical protein